MITQPDWLPPNNPASRRIFEKGFAGVPDDYLVFGSKGENIFDVPYADKLAAFVPPEDNLIRHFNFSRWKAKDANAEQYLDLGLIPGVPDDIISPFSFHSNLCGALVASTLVEIEPAYFIWSTLYFDDWGWDFYSNPDQGTNKYQLMDTFDYFGWESRLDTTPAYNYQCGGSRIIPGANDRAGQPFLCQIADWLGSGWVPVVGSNLWADSAHGILYSQEYAPNSNYRYAPHWVAVLQLISSKDGFSYVRIYNPFQNREEFYTWNDFYAAYQYGKRDMIRDSFLVRP